MSRQKSIAHLFTYNSLIVVSILTLSICAVLIGSKYLAFNTEINRVEEKFFQEQLTAVKTKVIETIDYLDYNKNRAEKVLEEDIQRRVNEAYQVASCIYKSNIGSKSRKEIEKMITDALRPIRFNKGRGYYFIDSLEQKIILYPPEPGLEGHPPPEKNALDEFIKLVKKNSEGFTSYRWYKPDKPNEFQPKTTYIKLFEPLGWIIGTGEYVEEVEKDIQGEVIDRIRTIRFGTENQYYLFVIALAGDKTDKDKTAKVKVNPQFPGIEGEDIPFSYTDARGSLFFKKMAMGCLNSGDAVQGYWQQSESGQLKEKILYARLYPGWNWLVGSGFYPADFKIIIENDKKRLRAAVRSETIMIIAIFTFILLLTFFLSSRFAHKIKKEFDIFSNFFKESAKKNELLEKDKLKINEFRELAESANKMIGDKKTNEEILLKAKSMAEAATRLKSEFLANVSHEIRTPMNAIIGMGEILAQTELTEEQLEYLEILNNSAISLVAIVKDILDFSRMETGKIILEKKLFNLRGIVEGVADMVAVEAQEKKIELLTSIAPNIPIVLMGDPARLHQVLLNLTNNAIKFTDEGEIQVSVEIEEDSKKEIKLVFRIQDTGIGLSIEGQRTLFKTSSQIGTTLTRRHEGTGLGLALSRRLTELMKGEIGAESKPGHGSIFWFSAVFEKVDSALEKELDAATPVYILNGLRVLVVDDNENICRTLCRYLEARGVICADAGDALEAYSKLQAAAAQNPFNAALIDYNMPDISGVQIAQMIKDSAEIKNTRLVLVSSSIDYKSKKELSEMGFDAFLNKPVKQIHLYNSIAMAMGYLQPVIPGEKLVLGKDFINRMKVLMDKPLEILLVEDNYFNQKVVEFNLKKFGHSIDIAENGKIAVNKFQKKRYDLILMDVKMPIMNGYETTRAIRLLEEERRNTTGQESHIPIIAMTANVAEGDEIKSLEAGMDAHLTKPFNFEKFIGTINEIITRSGKP